MDIVGISADTEDDKRAASLHRADDVPSQKVLAPSVFTSFFIILPFLL